MATEARIRPLRPDDVEVLASQMRAEDAAEVMASCGERPLEGLRISVEHSAVVFALELGGELLAIFGVVRVPPATLIGEREDIVWALTSVAVIRHQRAFWKASQRAIAMLLEAYPLLWNAIDARYSAALRWAARLGAEVRPAVPWGVSGLPFHPVVWRRHV